MGANCESINTLNQNCLLQIFKNLSAAEKLKPELVCKRWKTLMRTFWKQLSRLETVNGKNFEFNSSKDFVNFAMGQKILLRSMNSLTELNLTKVQNPKKWTVMDWEDRDHMCRPVRHDISSISCILQSCCNIEILRLCCCIVEFNVPTLSKLIENNSCLKVLELADYCVTGDSLCQLEYGSLESLFLLSGSIEEMDFEAVEVECLNLKIFSLHKCEIVGSTKSILLMPMSLEQLDLSSDTNVGKSELRRMMNKMEKNLLPNLKVLRMAGNTNVNNGVLKVIAKHCRTLLALDISQCVITDDGIRSLGSMPNLICLIADDCHGVTGEGFLGCNKKLQILSACRYKFSLSQFSKLLDLQNLEQLTVGEECITNEYVNSAIEKVKSRTNNVPLRAVFNGSDIQPEKILNDCPRFTFHVEQDKIDYNFYEYFFGQ